MPSKNPWTLKQPTPQSTPLPRHLTLTDLISIGVGGTVGSGIFVLCGLIASTHSGPATCISWLLAGVAGSLSGLCYAELSARMPSSGSAYVYVYATVGELPALVAGGCVTLEYMVAGAAVARSWGDKVVEWLQIELGWESANVIFLPGWNFNPLAAVISITATVLLSNGVQESKRVTDLFTFLKVGLVIFMTIGGFFYYKSSNLSPFVPPEFGVSGVLRGATSSFFGYLGYDEICCVAGEAVDPHKNLPKAVLITLATVTTLYIFAALSLTGMQVSELSSQKLSKH